MPVLVQEIMDIFIFLILNWVSKMTALSPWTQTPFFPVAPQSLACAILLQA